MPKAKPAAAKNSASTPGAKSAKPASRRKAHPKFELPEESAQKATAWAFRDEAPAGRITEVPRPVAMLTMPAEKLPELASESPVAPAEATVATPWAGSVFLTGAVIGTTAIGFGVAVLTTYAALRVMTAPARLARSMFT